MEEKQEEKREEKTSFAEFVFEWLQCIVFAMVLVIFIFTLIGKTMEVNNISMNPTLYDGDRLVVSSLLYTPSNGDIIVFATKTYEDGKPLVKRVIALGGQTVDIDARAGTVTVDGEVLDEPYINDFTYTLYEVEFPLTVPEGFVFVMGDNRNHSADSRSTAVGMVDEREIFGGVKAVMLPLSNFKIF